MPTESVSATAYRAGNFSLGEPAPADSRWYVGTLVYLTDVEREIGVPVGVVLFAEGLPLWGIRIPKETERIPGVPASALPGIKLMRDLIYGWIESAELPYATERQPPFSLDWWRHLAGLLGHRVRLEALLPTPCDRACYELVYWEW